eukprot:7383995-Prymnesium_polylepis.3
MALDMLSVTTSAAAAAESGSFSSNAPAPVIEASVVDMSDGPPVVGLLETDATLLTWLLMSRSSSLASMRATA